MASMAMKRDVSGELEKWKLLLTYQHHPVSTLFTIPLYIYFRKSTIRSYRIRIVWIIKACIREKTTMSELLIPPF